MKNKKGFTLAEVLVTLAVIGVVAALTIPALLQSSNERQAKTSIKKALSVLNQALTMSIAQNGVDTASNASIDSLELMTLFKTYMSTITSDDTNTNFTTSDGFVYTFNVGTGPCASTITGTAMNCVVEVDINGDKGTETAGTTSNFQDIYYFVVLKDQVVPANTTTLTWGDFGRGNDSGFGTTSDSTSVVMKTITGEI